LGSEKYFLEEKIRLSFNQ